MPQLPIELIFHPRRYVQSFVSRTRTDSTGAYRFDATEGIYDLALGSDYGSSGFDAALVPSVHVHAPVTRQDYRYSGFPVTGMVTIPGGTAIDSAYVDVLERVDSSDYETPFFYAQVRAGPQGYTMFLPHAGRYNFYVTPARAYSGVPRRFFKDLAIAADTTLDFALDGYATTGSVTLGGVPLDSVRVEAFSDNGSGSAMTNAGGTYLMYLPDGAYDWYVTPSGPSAYIYPLQQPGPDVHGPGAVDFDVSGVRWSGVVRMVSTGDPVPSVTVTAWHGDPYRSAKSVTDALGQFHLVVRRDARWNVFVTPPTAGLTGATIYGILAGSDSTFDLTVAPASP